MEKKPFLTKEKAQDIVKKYPTPFHIYDEKGIRNHFASAKPWYPQIVITAEKNNTTTTKIIDTK